MNTLTKDEIAKIMQLECYGAYDIALPQQWLDNTSIDLAIKLKLEVFDIYETLRQGCIWFYPFKTINYQYPFPLTDKAIYLLSQLGE